MSKNGDAGRREETRVVNWLQAHGWQDAEHIAKYGNHDRGDVKWVKGVVVEVKHRRTTTSNAGLGQPGVSELAKWMAELDAEVLNANADLGWLIVKRSGTTDVSQWWAYIPLMDLAHLMDGEEVFPPMLGQAPVCMTVATAEKLMAKNYTKGKVVHVTGTPVPPALPELREPAA